MNVRHKRVGLGRDDGAGHDGWIVLRHPGFPQSGHWAFVAKTDGEGLFVGLSPFEKRVSGNEAAAVCFPGISVGGFFVQPFGTGVERGECADLFRPRGNQTPAHEREFARWAARTVIKIRRRNVRSRSDIDFPGP